ncbi:hypothetical protein GCM10023156_40850 [Novipirellula rosea]|uniref:Uncharacterized protein n=1 Tax=Novipirellula rosea TaxID=1031540 RepID=A0ABP8N5M1_9BACT
MECPVSPCPSTDTETGLCQRASFAHTACEDRKWVRQKDFKDGMLGSSSRSRTELASRWHVRSVQPEVGQENGKAQEN